jgi:SAM-dependent methyltransferase
MLPVSVSKVDKIRTILDREPVNITNGQFWYVNNTVALKETAGKTLFGHIQDYFKKYPIVYHFIVDHLSAVKSSARFNRVQKSLIEKYNQTDVVVSYGSGPKVYFGRSDIVNVDLFAFDCVDVIIDTNSILPFVDNSVDYIISIAVLEHVAHPSVMVSEMFRCLKPGGEALIFVPFIQPIHAAPNDYHRWTPSGLRELFRQFNVVQLGVGAGPTSGLLWVFQHWIATLLSFGSSTIKDILLILLTITLFPIKYIDVILEHFGRGEDIASGYFIHCERPMD